MNDTLISSTGFRRLLVLPLKKLEFVRCLEKLDQMSARLISLRAGVWLVVASTLFHTLVASAAAADDAPSLAEAILAAAAPSPFIGAPAPAPLAPPPKPLTLRDRVVAAIRAAGHYGAISGLLDSLSETSVIKEGITFFAPDDGAFSGLNMNNSMLFMNTLHYHVATAVYSYQQLSYLPLNSTIQTAAPNVVMYITSTGEDGLMLDNVVISDPDLYLDDKVAVHGISMVMDTAKYNKGVVPPEAAPAAVAGAPSASPGLTTTPTTPGTTSPAAVGNDAAHVVSSAANAAILVAAVLFLSLLFQI